jgi:hypothetical protein
MACHWTPMQRMNNSRLLWHEVAYFRSFSEKKLSDTVEGLRPETTIIIF